MRSVFAAICLCGFVAAIAVSLAPLDAADDVDPLVTCVYPIADLPVWSTRGNEPQFDPTVLIAHIKATVDPESWKDATIGAHQKDELAACLVVRQSRANHQSIAELIHVFRPKYPNEEEETVLGIDKEGKLVEALKK